MKNIAFFVYGLASHMQTVLKNINKNEIKNCTIKIAICSKNDKAAIGKIKSLGINLILEENWSEAGFSSMNEYIIHTLSKHKIDLICLDGYRKIIPKEIINVYQNKILNVHPSLIPAFSGKGFYGIKTYQAIYDSGVKISGVTAHFVDENIDTGLIITQEHYEINSTDNFRNIQKKGIQLEHAVYVKAVKAIIDNKVHIENNKIWIE